MLNLKSLWKYDHVDLIIPQTKVYLYKPWKITNAYSKVNIFVSWFHQSLHLAVLVQWSNMSFGQGRQFNLSSMLNLKSL
jgi:hypothetical protein